MKTFILTTLMASVVLFNQCNKHKKDQDQSGTPEAQTQEQQQVQETTKETEMKDADQQKLKNLIVDKSFVPPQNPERTYKIKSQEVVGDTLNVQVVYKGGCGEHNFDLYTNGLMMKSLPPQFNLFIVHEVKNDTCDQKIEELLRFDVSALKEERYQKVVLNVDSYKHKAEYVY